MTAQFLGQWVVNLPSIRAAISWGGWHKENPSNFHIKKKHGSSTNGFLEGYGEDIAKDFMEGKQKTIMTGWWFCFNPSEKYVQVKLGSSSPNRGENKNYLSCHHLDDGWRVILASSSFQVVFPHKHHSKQQNVLLPLLQLGLNPPNHLEDDWFRCGWVRACRPLFFLSSVWCSP